MCSLVGGSDAGQAIGHARQQQARRNCRQFFRFFSEFSNFVFVNFNMQILLSQFSAIPPAYLTVRLPRHRRCTVGMCPWLRDLGAFKPAFDFESLARRLLFLDLRLWIEFDLKCSSLRSVLFGIR